MFWLENYYVTLEAMWNPLPADYGMSLDVGIGVGILNWNWDTDELSPSRITSLVDRYNVGLTTGDIVAGGLNPTGYFDASANYVNAELRAQTDFFTDSQWDAGVSLALGGGMATVEGNYESQQPVGSAKGYSGEDTSTAWHIALGAEGGYSTADFNFGMRVELFSLNTISGDRLNLKAMGRFGLYVGIRF